MHRLLALTLALVGCSVRGEDHLCRADVQQGLINPETAEFFEFEPISNAAAEQQFYLGILKMRGVDPAEIESRYGRATDRAFRQVARETIGSLARDGATFRRYRVKADSRVGLTVTSTYVCAVSPSECSCFDPDHMGAVG